MYLDDDQLYLIQTVFDALLALEEVPRDKAWEDMDESDRQLVLVRVQGLLNDDAEEI